MWCNWVRAISYENCLMAARADIRAKQAEKPCFFPQSAGSVAFEMWSIPKAECSRTCLVDGPARLGRAWLQFSRHGGAARGSGNSQGARNSQALFPTPETRGHAAALGGRCMPMKRRGFEAACPRLGACVRPDFVSGAAHAKGCFNAQCARTASFGMLWRSLTNHSKMISFYCLKKRIPYYICRRLEIFYNLLPQAQQDFAANGNTAGSGLMRTAFAAMMQRHSTRASAQCFARKAHAHQNSR